MGIIAGMRSLVIADTPRLTVTGIVLLRTKHPQRLNQTVRAKCLSLQHEIRLALCHLNTQFLVTAIQGPKPQNAVQSIPLQQVCKLRQELPICISPQNRARLTHIINKVKLIRHKDLAIRVQPVGARHDCALILVYNGACLVTYLPGHRSVSVVDEALGARDREVTVQKGNAVAVVDVSAEKEVSDGTGEDISCALIFKRLGSGIETWEGIICGWAVKGSVAYKFVSIR